MLELRGTVCMDVDHEPAAQQQMMCSRSFGAAVTDLSELVEVVSQFATRVAEKARQQAAAAGSVHVFITTSPHRSNDRQHSPSITVPLVRPSADTRVIVAAAVQAVRQMHRAGFNYAKAGVMLVDLQAQGQQQGELDLFGSWRAGWCRTRHGVTSLDGRRRFAQPTLRQRRRDGCQCPAPPGPSATRGQAVQTFSPIHDAPGRDRDRACVTTPGMRFPRCGDPWQTTIGLGSFCANHTPVLAP